MSTTEQPTTGNSNVVNTAYLPDELDSLVEATMRNLSTYSLQWEMEKLEIQEFDNMDGEDDEDCDDCEHGDDDTDDVDDLDEDDNSDGDTDYQTMFDNEFQLTTTATGDEDDSSGSSDSNDSSDCSDDSYYSDEDGYLDAYSSGSSDSDSSDEEDITEEERTRRRDQLTKLICDKMGGADKLLDMYDSCMVNDCDGGSDSGSGSGTSSGFGSQPNAGTQLPLPSDTSDSTRDDNKMLSMAELVIAMGLGDKLKSKVPRIRISTDDGETVSVKYNHPAFDYSTVLADAVSRNEKKLHISNVTKENINDYLSFVEAGDLEDVDDVEGAIEVTNELGDDLNYYRLMFPRYTHVAVDDNSQFVDEYNNIDKIKFEQINIFITYTNIEVSDILPESCRCDVESVAFSMSSPTNGENCVYFCRCMDGSVVAYIPYYMTKVTNIDERLLEWGYGFNIYYDGECLLFQTDKLLEIIYVVGSGGSKTQISDMSDISDVSNISNMSHQIPVNLCGTGNCTVESTSESVVESTPESAVECTVECEPRPTIDNRQATTDVDATPQLNVSSDEEDEVETDSEPDYDGYEYDKYQYYDDDEYQVCKQHLKINSNVYFNITGIAKNAIRVIINDPPSLTIYYGHLWNHEHRGNDYVLNFDAPTQSYDEPIIVN